MSFYCFLLTALALTLASHMTSASSKCKDKKERYIPNDWRLKQLTEYCKYYQYKIKQDLEFSEELQCLIEKEYAVGSRKDWTVFSITSSSGQRNNEGGHIYSVVHDNAHPVFGRLGRHELCRAGTFGHNDVFACTFFKPEGSFWDRNGDLRYGCAYYRKELLKKE